MTAAAPHRLPQHAEAVVLSLVGEIYRAASAPERWPSLLAALGDRLDAVSIHLMIDKEVASGAVAGPWYWAGGERDPREVMAGYEGRRASIFGSAELYVPGSVVPSDETCPRDLLRRSEFHAECLRPLGVDLGLCGVVDGEGGRRSLVTAMGSEACLDAGSVGLLACLLPHLAQAVAIQRRLGTASWERSAAAAALDALSIGVVLFDGRGDARFANREAERIVAEGDGLALVRGTLAAADPGQSALLAALVAAACGTGSGERTLPGGALAVERPSGRRPYSVRVAPMVLSGDAGELAPLQTAAIAFLGDPARRGELPEDTLRRLYGLTPSEARLAAWLAGGESLAGFAEAHGVTLNTVRTHMKRVFEKTGVRRQSELVGLLLRSLAPLFETRA